MVTRTPPWENLKPISLPRSSSRRRDDSPTTMAAAPAAKAERWDFTPASYAALVAAGGDLKVAADSNWFPAPLRENLLATLRSLLDPERAPAATWGANPKDFFHGHVVLPPGSVSEALEKQREEFDRFQENATRAALGSLAGPVTAQNLPAYKEAMGEIQTAAKSLLDDALKRDGVAVIYHTFESKEQRPANMLSGDPQRHWLAPLSTNQPHSFQPEDPRWADMNNQTTVLSFGFLVDARGEAHICPGGSYAFPTITGNVEAK